MLRAKDVMSRRVITVAPRMTVDEVGRLFQRLKITGAPVVDEDGELLGVVSQTDLVRHDQAPQPLRTPAFYQEGERIVVAPQIAEAGQIRVSAVMTPVVLEAGEDTPVRELACLMLRHRIHRVVIVRQGRLAGIVTSLDLLKVLSGKRL